MALNLLKAGHTLTVWNRTEAACQPLVDAGATLASSAAGVCEKSELTFVMVSTPEAALFCAKAAAPGLSAGKGYVDVSTVDPSSARTIADHIRSTCAEFLEAPVSGSKAHFHGMVFNFKREAALLQLLTLLLTLWTQPEGSW